MGRNPEESDWKAYSRSIPEWRDRYFKKVNSELVKFLQREGHTPTENFRYAYEEGKASQNIGGLSGTLFSLENGYVRFSDVLARAVGRKGSGHLQ